MLTVKMVKKGQVWSFDLIAAIVIFFLIFIFLINKVDLFGGDRIEELQDKAKSGTLAFQQEGPLQFLERNTVDEAKLDVLVSNFLNDPAYYDYSKSVLGFSDVDYCFYFEDQDGNLVLINNSLVGVGSDELEIGGHQCGVLIN